MITDKNQFFSINDLMPLIKETISEGRSIHFSVTGNSMFPLFANRRDSVTVSPVDSIRKYDIVLHRRADGTYIMHRVIGIKGNMLTIAGDNENKKEKNVPLDAVIAKVTSFTRKGRIYNMKELSYRLYSHLWLWVFPARLFILGLLLWIRGLMR